uniref:hypothetical protein n=1 Tax=Asaia spathodeae TaxID=657016 RepID=UPI002FC2F5D3
MEEKDPDSPLALYRSLLAHRKAFSLGLGALEWAPERKDVVEFCNGPVRVILNCGDKEVTLPEGEILVASHAIEKPGFLPANAAVWMTEKAD